MRKILLVREIYSEGFKNLGNTMVQNSFRAMSFICFALFTVVVYAFIYRMATGFAF